MLRATGVSSSVPAGELSEPAETGGTAFHSVLAGFVDPGETFEECVRGEVLEEVAIEEKEIAQG